MQQNDVISNALINASTKDDVTYNALINASDAFAKANQPVQATWPLEVILDGLLDKALAEGADPPQAARDAGGRAEPAVPACQGGRQRAGAAAGGPGCRGPSGASKRCY